MKTAWVTNPIFPDLVLHDFHAAHLQFDIMHILQAIFLITDRRKQLVLS
jgi:hypothetical protein